MAWLLWDSSVQWTHSEHGGGEETPGEELQEDDHHGVSHFSSTPLQGT